MSRRWTVSAGVLDAGLASLASFLVGLYAIRYFEPIVIGAYALVFAAFNLAVIAPRELIYLPAEIAAVARPLHERLALLPRSLRLGLPTALGASLLVTLWSLAGPPEIPSDAKLALTLTGVACTFLSPVQDHLRRMLHIGGRGWTAVVVSLVQTSVTLGAILIMVDRGVPEAWIPFGALAAANLLSLVAGGLCLTSLIGAAAPEAASLTFAELLESGRWLFLSSVLAPGSILLAAVMVSHLAGPASLGYAEAARVLGRPLGVLALGLSSALGPASIAAGQKRQRSEAKRVSRLYLKLLVSFGAVYLLVAGVDAPWNPLADLLPNAYIVTGLAAAVIVGEVLAVIQFPHRHELLGGGRAAALTRIELGAMALRCAVSATAGFTAAFAIPLGNAAVTAVRAVGYRVLLRQTYARPPADGLRTVMPSVAAGEAGPS